MSVMYYLIYRRSVSFDERVGKKTTKGSLLGTLHNLGVCHPFEKTNNSKQMVL